MLLLFLSSAALWTASDHKTDLPANQAPRVVSTSPRPGSAIPPGPFVLSATFDRTMMEGNYSLVQTSAETFPQCARSATFSRDRRTFSLRCIGLAGRAYEIWFNRPPYMNSRALPACPPTRSSCCSRPGRAKRRLSHMQKPPEISGGSHRSEFFGRSDHDRRDDEDLCGKRDNAGCRGFHHPHGCSSVLIGARLLLNSF